MAPDTLGFYPSNLHCIGMAFPSLSTCSSLHRQWSAKSYLHMCTNMASYSYFSWSSLHTYTTHIHGLPVIHACPPPPGLPSIHVCPPPHGLWVSTPSWPWLHTHANQTIFSCMCLHVLSTNSPIQLEPTLMASCTFVKSSRILYLNGGILWVT